MTISMHLCRGNFRSTWVAAGGYEPVAEVLFNQINADAYFMEYDSDRAGGFEPLRFVPRGHKVVVLGLVTSKTGELESKDAAEAADRCGGEIPAAGAVGAVAAMRLRLDRGRQPADRGRSNGPSCGYASMWRARCGAACSADRSAIPAVGGAHARRGCGLVRQVGCVPAAAQRLDQRDAGDQPVLLDRQRGLLVGQRSACSMITLV